MIQRAIDGVAGTVARMREFYRQREPEMTLTLVDLNRVVKQVIELTRAKWFDLPQQRGISIELRTELADDLPGIMGAEGEIRDALTNLIFNAVDAMPEGGVLTVRTFERPGAGDTQLVTIEVTDTGVGMDEETRRRCLEPFFTTKGERGTGLGPRHGLRHDPAPQRRVRDRERRRARARPCASPSPRTRSHSWRNRVRPTPHVPMRRLRVLLIDDDPIIIKALEDALVGEGHVTVTANGGQAGLDRLPPRSRARIRSIWWSRTSACPPSMDAALPKASRVSLHARPSSC